ncbi:MAG TPA: dihydrofolate reductase family protein, partial [Chloroflexota bacterium]|nr:dihydrofolate reductase family protein [Chloroflexota bacterium]
AHFPPGILTNDGLRPFVAINMVSTLDGRAQMEGRARGIGSPIDRQLMFQLRANVDVVMNGAGTLRTDEVVVRLSQEFQELRKQRGESPQPRYAVVSTSGDIPTWRKAFDLTPPPIVLLGRDTPPDRIAELESRAEVVVLPEASPSPGSILAALGERFGARRILLEGGPTLNQVFLSAGLVDQVFLTLAPKILGGPPGLPIVAGSEPLQTIVGATLMSIIAHDDELFLRYRVTSEQTTA